ncbi:hypothetical protein Tco_1150635 [Tanacetum coccineum]
MTPATRTIASTSNNEGGNVNERVGSLDETLAQVTRAMQDMLFLGDDAKGWIFKCEQFFSIDEILENQKVKLIFVHLSDTALLWHRQFIRLNGENVSWDVYKSGILQRFGTVRVGISEEHAVSFYLGGLPAEIEMGVGMFRPKILADAYSLTNYQEATLEAVKKKSKIAMTFAGGRVRNGMVVLADKEDEYFEAKEGDKELVVPNKIPQISLNALNGANTFQTMRVTGKGRVSSDKYLSLSSHFRRK